MDDKPGMVQTPGGCLALLALCAAGLVMWVIIIFIIAQILAAIR